MLPQQGVVLLCIWSGKKEGMDMASTGGNKKQVVFLGILFLVVCLFVVGYLVKDKRGIHKIITSGDRAPEFRLQSSDGRSVSLSDFRGKVVMVHFWATWCPPCVEEMPTLDGLYRSRAGKDLEVLAVSVDEGGVGSVAPFMQKNRLTIPVLFDPRREVAGQYGTFKFPETYIVDRQGVVRYKVIGSRDWADPANIKILQDIIEAR